MKTIFQFNHKFLLSLFPVLVLIVMVSGAVLAQSQPQDIQLVRTLDADKTGLVNPNAIAFSSRANVFHVVDTLGNSINDSTGLVIKNISVFGHDLGSTSLDISVDYPIFLAMDDQQNRLLIYQVNTSQLYEVYEDPDGKIDPNTLTWYDLSYLNLSNPTGMTYDQLNNYLYFLDAGYPRLVRVASSSDGNLTDAVVDEVSFPGIGSNVLQGVAFNSVSGDLYSINLSEQVLYEFTNSGGVVASRDLSALNLNNPQELISAPSGDQTDDPKEYSIYLVASGSSDNAPSVSADIENNFSAGNYGKIVELSMNQRSVQDVQAVSDFPSTLVETTYTSAFDPPSPDPTGLTYISSDVPGDRRLLISDADVEETRDDITHFEGVNLWEVTLGGNVEQTANISFLPPTFVPMTNEPTGIALNPGTGHYYFSDDDDLAVFDLNPGIDGMIGTADDSWSSFDTIAENGDPEGIAYDSWHDQLYVIDGTNLEVYVYTLAGDYISHFDVASLGALDTESIEFNPISGTFFILSNLTSRNIYEIEVQYSETPTDSLTITPTLTIDMSSVLAEDPAGLAYAPASDGSDAMRFYVVDRGVDNGFDPTENDGKMYELTAPSPTLPENSPPVVNAGLDQDIAYGDTANLVGSVDDDGLPNPPGGTITSWTKSSGPGTVTFGDPGSLSTTATFSTIGNYALRLTADDGEYSTYDELSVNVTSVAGSSILEIRLVSSSDDAEENVTGVDTGVVNLVSPDLELVLDAYYQIVGIRFNGVTLPKNAIVDYAYVQFESREIGSSSILLSISGEAQDNPGTFVGTNYNISSRTKTVSAVSWSPPAWTQVNQAGLGQRTSDITTVIQEIISRPGWSEGNSTVILINGTSGRRTAWSFDGLPSGAPRLHIEYTLSDNHVPVANDDTYTTDENSLLSTTQLDGVLDNDYDADGDDLTAHEYTTPAHGSLALNSDGSFDYMPDTDYTGSDSFTYYNNDGEFNSNIATVNITVTPPSDETSTSINCGGGNPIVTYGSSIVCEVTVSRSTGLLTPGGLVDWTSNGSGSFTPNPCNLSGADGTGTCSVTYTPSAVGTGVHLVTGTYTGDSNFSGSDGSQSVSVEKADATCSVSGYSGVYDAVAHGASGSCSGIGEEDAGTLNLGASYTDVPGGTAHWAFTGNGNYNDQEGDVSITLTKIDATCSVSGYSGVYDATPHGASGLCEGIGGEIAGTLDLGASYTDVPGGTAHWTFTGNSNYNNQSGDVLITITKVQITVTADNKTKVVGEPDPPLTYSYLPGLLLPGDIFSGELTREPGENVGSYAIQRGTLSLSNNYNLFFVEGTFTITNGVIYLPLIIR
jgi:uncharacterized protein YjiK